MEASKAFDYWSDNSNQENLRLLSLERPTNRDEMRYASDNELDQANAINVFLFFAALYQMA